MYSMIIYFYKITIFFRLKSGPANFTKDLIGSSLLKLLPPNSVAPRQNKPPDYFSFKRIGNIDSMNKTN